MIARARIERTSHALFMRNMRQLDRQGQLARDQSIKATVHAGLQWILERSPVDTARYIRGVAMAGNKAEAGPFFEAPVVDSKNRDVYLQRLIEWVDICRKVEEQRDEKIRFLYPKGPPKRAGRGSLYAKLVKQRDKAASDLAKAETQLEKAMGATGILFVGSMWKGASRSGRGPTVRVPVYGGDGSFVSSQRQARCTIVIKEPHARFVEKKHHLFKDASEVMRKFGVGRFPKDVAAIATGAGFKVGKLSVSGSMGKGGR